MGTVIHPYSNLFLHFRSPSPSKPTTTTSLRHRPSLYDLQLQQSLTLDLHIHHFSDLLRFSVQSKDLSLARAIHAFTVKFHEDQHTHLGNPLISAYLKLGHLNYAYDVFHRLSSPNVVSYTALISGLAKSGREHDAIQLFFKMRRDCSIQPNAHTFVAILTACIRMLDLDLGLQVHALIVKMGFFDSVFVVNALMGLYGKFDWCLDYVLMLFDGMSHRDVVSWNTVISSVVRESMYQKAYELFLDMRRDSAFRVDSFTISTLLSACTGSFFGLMEGQAVHAHAIRIGLEGDLSVGNALIGFYTRFGCVKDIESVLGRMIFRDVVTWTELIVSYMEFGLVDLAVEVLDKMPEKNCVSYNAVLAGLCKNGHGLKAVELFVKMVERGLALTDFSLTSVVNACGLVKDVNLCEQIQGFVIKFGFGSNVHIEASVLDMWTRCGRMENSEKIFQQLVSDQDDAVICTSMICGYARNGQPENAICMFQSSQSKGMMIADAVALASVVGVCGTLGFHEMGKQIHCHALKTGLSSEKSVGNSLISMYFKCDNMKDAIDVFNAMPSRDVVSWNGLIAGHVLLRQGDEALSAWSRMENANIKPDAVTLLLVISAYRVTNSNFLDSCRKLFFSMRTIHDIEPTSEHYASFVSVLGHWGFLEESEKVINSMPFEPEASVWRALLDSCRIHLNTAIGKRCAKHILSMEPQDPSTYVLVSNLYSASGRWHNSEMVREDMRQKGFQKHPSRSWIIHQNKVHSFYARDKSHPQEKDIYSGLDILVLECLKAGYVPDTSFVLHEVEEYQKKNFLYYHSAKLAATYGILNTRPGQPVRVLKNIDICGDCHNFLKFVSVVTKREIVLRDASGFHRIMNGHCSCKDYWL